MLHEWNTIFVSGADDLDTYSYDEYEDDDYTYDNCEDTDGDGYCDYDDCIDADEDGYCDYESAGDQAAEPEFGEDKTFVKVDLGNTARLTCTVLNLGEKTFITYDSDILLRPLSLERVIVCYVARARG